MRTVARLWWLAALGGLGFWLWLTLFPSPQKVVRKTLEHLARCGSFSASQGVLARLAYAQKLADFFCTNVEINLDIRGHGNRRFLDREEIVQAAAGARSAVEAITVEFPNIAVKVSPDKQSAQAELTLEARVSGEHDPIVEEMKFTLQKIGGQWLITRVKTVRVFS
jgi:hypothetical protein